MKQILLLSFTALLMTSCGTSSQSNSSSINMNEAKVEDPTKYATSITAEELKEMLYKYASDEFEGRETGEKGQKMAVEYLKSQYQALNIPTPLGNDDYFQEVPLEKQSVSEAKITVNGKDFKSFEEHIVLRASGNVNVSTKEIVYVGYGIDSENYSDYKDLDVKGKIVLAKAGEPKDDDGNYVTTGNAEDTKWSSGRQSLSSKRDAAIENGAKGLMLLDSYMFVRYAPYYQRQAESGTSGRLSLKSNDDEMMMLMINENLAKALHPSILEDDKTKTLKTDLNLEIENKSEQITKTVRTSVCDSVTL